MTERLQAMAGSRLLLLNWRDLSHPRAGGAEVYCEEIGERLARAGAEVTLFTARPPGTAASEYRGGMLIRREGGTLGVYARAAQHLRRSGRRYDAVIDFQNGIPFFSPMFVPHGTAVVCVIHHVHQEQFALHFPWPVSRVGQLLEGPVSRGVYRGRPLVAVSPSTRRDIRRRLRLRGQIHVIPNGIVTDAQRVPRERSAAPSIVVVSRLVSHKRFDLLLDAVPELRRRWPELRIDIAGDGPERPVLERRARTLRLGDAVRFHGFVSSEVRRDLLSSAWLTVNPSQAEGWGLTVIEANAAGVPAVAYDVPGLRDSIVDGETGWLLRPGRTLAEGIDAAIRELGDASAAAALSDRCRAWAGCFSWDASAERLAGVVASEVDRMRRTPRSRRRSSDLSVRIDAEVPGAAGPGTPLPHAIRRSDQWSVEGTRVRLLLHGCDETGAEEALRRLGAVENQQITLATTTDLLVGTG